MNTVSDGQPLGKTIFIDNPFGAAKDIYIWEPIFKLLAVNHVQLIVPARGATPAITSRFDVNYILGQKMADKRQQTVVVDYYSNVKETEFISVTITEKSRFHESLLLIYLKRSSCSLKLSAATIVSSM